MSQMQGNSRGKFDRSQITPEGTFLGEPNENNRYHLRQLNDPKPLTLKGSTGNPTYGTLLTVLMVDKRLNANAKLLWTYLHFRQGKNDTAWPSQTTISAHTNLSRSTVSRATKDLEELKWLRVFRTSAGTQRWNSYKVQIPDYALEKIDSSAKKKPIPTQKEATVVSNPGDSMVQNDAVKTPLKTPDKNTKITTHQSRLVPDFSSIFHSAND